ncbi:LysR substrate-binding domain-containing protein [Acinetobacter sp. ANC 3832]|uniref:LysR substrate-binding domain-containing protein n=1 Tax=Acinetobacter sp. ANC 3832 TaxID=1977874 RepID=UPI000A35B11C|nr:LysR substrate-binding domain-containing protein [Acinetobacter sp. ANC 3832]OTG94749.1 LysR family transcriptional regulator [Acinetobacter sp. ANC 3832]
MSLEIKWIEDLIAVERTRSISKAAEIRFVSQSAFTRRLQHIEKSLGFQIIERNFRDIQFTEAGQVLLSTAKDIEKQLNETIQLLHNMGKENNMSIRFAVAHSLASNFFSNFIKLFPSNIENFKLEIIATNVNEGINLLKEGACDFLICYADKNLISSINLKILSYLQIGETDIVPVTLLNDQGQPKFDIHQFFPLLTYSPKAYLRILVNELLDTQKLTYRILYETDNANNVKDLVLQGLGIAWLPKLTIKDELIKNQLVICDENMVYKAQQIFILKSNLIHRESISMLWNQLRNQIK